MGIRQVALMTLVQGYRVSGRDLPMTLVHRVSGRDLPPSRILPVVLGGGVSWQLWTLERLRDYMEGLPGLDNNIIHER